MMRINTNKWNVLRYTFYTPVYDFIARFSTNSRKKSIASLNILPGHRVLIVGAGTGLDLKLLPKHCEIVATDITPSMVESIKRKNNTLGLNVEIRVMDGQQIEYEDAAFDIVILHLILAVIPDPMACIREVDRVLKTGGQVAVYDKFVKKNKAVSKLRSFLNLFTNIFFSNITRDIYTIVAPTSLSVKSDFPADFKGQFRLIQLRKA